MTALVLAIAALVLSLVAAAYAARVRRRSREIETRLDILRAVVDGAARREREDA